jgi:hypothetical protein
MDAAQAVGQDFVAYLFRLEPRGKICLLERAANGETRARDEVNGHGGRTVRLKSQDKARIWSGEERFRDLQNADGRRDARGAGRGRPNGRGLCVEEFRPERLAISLRHGDQRPAEDSVAAFAQSAERAVTPPVHFTDAAAEQFVKQPGELSRAIVPVGLGTNLEIDDKSVCGFAVGAREEIAEAERVELERERRPVVHRCRSDAVELHGAVELDKELAKQRPGLRHIMAREKIESGWKLGEYAEHLSGAQLPPPAEKVEQRDALNPFLDEDASLRIERMQANEVRVREALETADRGLEVLPVPRFEAALTTKQPQADDLRKDMIACAEKPPAGEVWHFVEQFIAIGDAGDAHV